MADFCSMCRLHNVQYVNFILEYIRYYLQKQTPITYKHLIGIPTNTYYKL